ncbi:MAG: DUF1553 domain-containing protein [Bryobacterales bacterium]|nr:DUF1553 domain-containing protein [Bryobacterales bacterium]MDE0624082.1 DUF1553 domain-containing protein [Bryobacterales bacterium]
MRAVDFDRDVRPILSDNCYACHGPDASKRQANLRLDVEEEVRRVASEALRRVASDDVSTRMPPAYLGHDQLPDGEIAILQDWVEAGAPWSAHWAFVAPARPGQPSVRSEERAHNAIDRFVFKRLEQAGLKPSPEADRRTLIRRLSLDLTGLPPDVGDVRAFLDDASPDGYERLVDRLLDSPRYGERMASRWLDAARYADTQGYQNDAPVQMWRWRDWVIEAFNSNKPFDEFTVEQIAGDMLGDPTLDQLIATGFNRNHRSNSELGIVDEEYRVEYVVDRVETMSTVFLGLTVGCARCHDHKYDPISQKEFYQLFAYFNNVPERGRVLRPFNSPPRILAPTKEEARKLEGLADEISLAEESFSAIREAASEDFEGWERKLAQSAEPLNWLPRYGLAARFDFEGDQLDAMPSGEIEHANGRVGRALRLRHTGHLEAKELADYDYNDSFSLAAWIQPESPEGVILSRSQTFNAHDENAGRGFTLALEEGKLKLKLIGRMDDWIIVSSRRALPLNRWTHVAATYDGSRLAGGITFYIDGRKVGTVAELDYSNGGIKTKEPFRIGAGADKGSGLLGSIDEVAVYGRELTADEVSMLAVAEDLNEVARIQSDDRTDGQRHKLERAFADTFGTPAVKSSWADLNRLRRARDALMKRVSSVMIMAEMNTPRETFILERGAYDQPGARVSPGVLSALPSLPESAPNNRLGLAQWLVDPANPLMARVTVNRLWQMLFGEGLVRTPENLGTQGERPTHPELLDWLAVEFVESGWDVKSLLKTIAMSATYRQESKRAADGMHEDPTNRLLARGPRFRLSAEAVRDQALLLAGLLRERLGGPSVKTYQPDGLWYDIAAGGGYTRDTGENLYRRSLYTYWRRTIGPPSMLNFDSATRETCTVRTERTNTPLQALNLMNDVTFVEASRKFGERIYLEGGQSTEERLAHGFEMATGRTPSPRESEILERAFANQLQSFKVDPNAAEQLLAQGDSPVDERMTQGELAAFAMTAGMILNLDETVTKQ